jgi:hypothetical protein
MQSIVNAFTIPSGYSSEDVNRMAMRTFMDGFKTKQAVTGVGGGPQAVPLAVQSNAASLNRPNGSTNNGSFVPADQFFKRGNHAG